MNRRRTKGALITPLLMVVLGIAACDRKRDDEPLAECTAYVQRLQTCFGDHTSEAAKGAYATPPKDDVAREAMRARCIKQDAFVRSACH